MFLRGTPLRGQQPPQSIARIDPAPLLGCPGYKTSRTNPSRCLRPAGMLLLRLLVCLSRSRRTPPTPSPLTLLLCFQFSERANGQTIEPCRSLNLFSSKQSLQHTRHTAMNGPLILSVSNGCASVGRSPWPQRGVRHSSHLSSDRAAVPTASHAPHLVTETSSET